MAKPKAKLDHAALLAALVTQVLDGPARIAAGVRRAASQLGSDGAAGVPAAAKAYLDKVARWAYKVTDEDVAALTAAGLGEDEIFELTIAAAVGAGARRQAAARRALAAAGKQVA